MCHIWIVVSKSAVFETSPPGGGNVDSVKSSGPVLCHPHLILPVLNDRSSQVSELSMFHMTFPIKTWNKHFANLYISSWLRWVDVPYRSFGQVPRLGWVHFRGNCFWTQDVKQTSISKYVGPFWVGLAKARVLWFRTNVLIFAHRNERACEFSEQSKLTFYFIQVGPA